LEVSDPIRTLRRSESDSVTGAFDYFEGIMDPKGWSSGRRLVLQSFHLIFSWLARTRLEKDMDL